MKLPHKAILAFAATILPAAVSSAAILYYEDFNLGLADGASMSGQDGWTTTNLTFEATGLTSPYGTSAGGAMRFGASHNGIQSNWGAAGLPANGTYWYSFTLSLEGTRSRGTAIIFSAGGDGQNGFGVRIDKDSGQIAAWSPHQGASANAATFVDGATYNFIGKVVVDAAGTSTNTI